MQEGNPATEFQQFSPPSAFRLVAMQIVCLSAVGLIAMGALLASIFQLSAQGLTAEWIGMTLDPLIASLGCGASLAFSMARPSKTQLAASRILACAAVIPAFFVLLNRVSGSVTGIESLIHPVRAPVQAGAMPIVVALAFVLLAVVLCLIRTSRGIGSYAADGLMYVLGFLILALVSSWLFRAMHVVDMHYIDRTPPATLCILALLILVTFSVRARYGAFDILVGAGLGSRIARALTPVMLALPFLREAGRARLIRLHLLPEHSETAVLASIAAMIALGLLIVIARHIRRMEKEIQQLSLRDELTGLNNLRGFRLLAEQALRLAYRSQMPFSVLFVDLDGLKKVNDTLGHAVGSALLVETAELLTASFRETDVVARIGGDEFAVAGQFSHSGIVLAAQRLEDQASRTRAEACGGRPLSLSIGYATHSDHRRQSLQELIDEADSNMYDQKRRKRLQAC